MTELTAASAGTRTPFIRAVESKRGTAATKSGPHTRTNQRMLHAIPETRGDFYRLDFEQFNATVSIITDFIGTLKGWSFR